MSLGPLNQTIISIHRVAEAYREPDWEIEKTDRPYTVFWYILSGEKKVEVDDKQFIVREGDFVIFPTQKTFALLKGETSLHHLEIAIENKYGPFDLFVMYDFPVVIKQETSFQSLIELWRKLYADWTPNRFRYFSTVANEGQHNLVETIDFLEYYSLAITWFTRVLTIIKPYSVKKSQHFDPRLQQLFIFIRNHISKKLSLEKLANEVYISESHLSLLFRQSIKISPMEYVRNVRLQKARELLLTTNLQLKEIAELVGFEGQSQLSRAFKKNVGVSPIDYRNKGQNI